MNQSVLPLVILFCSCTSNKIGTSNEPNPDGMVDTSDTGRADTAAPEPEEEACDGVDNDGDGLIDEGFDLDGDGIGDCLQCTVGSVSSVKVSGDDACAPRPPQEGIWETEFLWQYTHHKKASHGTCAYARAADINKDGHVDILCVSRDAGARLYAIDGSNGTLLWEHRGARIGNSIALADIEGDGDIDTITLSSDDRLLNISYSGISEDFGSERVGRTQIYAPCRRDPSYCTNEESPLTIADLDHDGEWEVLTVSAILSGKTQEVLSWLEHDFGDDINGYADWYAYDILHADLAGSATDEIIVGDRVYAADGQHLWNIPREFPSQDTRFLSTLIVEADDDEKAELIAIREKSFYVLNGDGQIINQVFTDEKHITDSGSVISNISIACAGDIDGDGVTELLIPAYMLVSGSDKYSIWGDGLLSAWELNGDFLWSVEGIHVNGQRSNCQVFDFNGDGAHEVIFTDNVGTHILDGTEGSEQILIPAQADDFATQRDEVLIADLDGDGSVELIVAYAYGGGTLPSVEVYTHPEGRWPIGSRIWPTGTWSGAGMDSSGAPQNDQSRPWLDPGLFRGQTSVHVEGVDVQPVIHDACTAEAEVRLSVGAENLGPNDLTSQVRFTVSQPDGSVIAEDSLTRGITAGTGSETVEFVLAPEDAAGGVVVSLETPDAPDCNPLNNELAWEP